VKSICSGAGFVPFLYIFKLDIFSIKPVKSALFMYYYATQATLPLLANEENKVKKQPKLLGYHTLSLSF